MWNPTEARGCLLLAFSFWVIVTFFKTLLQPLLVALPSQWTDDRTAAGSQGKEAPPSEREEDPGREPATQRSIPGASAERWFGLKYPQGRGPPHSHGSSVPAGDPRSSSFYPLRTCGHICAATDT